MASNPNIRLPFLPTVPLPVNVISTGMLYMYTCSQCDFKTHIEGMFKQHVDSIHLGITTAGSNTVMNTSLASLATTLVPVSLGQTILLTTTPIASISGATLSSTLAQQQQQQQEHEDEQEEQEALSIESKFKCLKCGEILPSKNQLILHKRKLHGKNIIHANVSTTSQFQQSIVQAQVVQANQQPTSPQQAPVQLQSVIHHQQADQILTVQLNQSNNTSGKKTYACSSCGYSTSRRDGLSQHYDSVHLKIKSHQCELCPYAASQKGTLNRHVKLRHRQGDLESLQLKNDPLAE